MDSDSPTGSRRLRYEPGERPPLPLALGQGVQFAITTIVLAVLIPTISFRAAGAADAMVAWAVFVSVLACGVVATLQAVRLGQFGAGFLMVPAVSSAAIAVTTEALTQGGPAMLATLVVTAALFQMGCSTRLSLLRKILTPIVSGTVLLLIPVSVMPIVFGMLDRVPEAAPAIAAPVAALVTLFVICGITLQATGTLRLWAPIIGVAAGSAVAWPLGLVDLRGLAEASWFAIPSPEWPGLDLGFGSIYWSLLPAFLFVTLVTSLQAISSAVAIQGVSWRRPQAVDFRAVGGAVSANGLGSLLSGVAGAMPLSTLSLGASMAEITGIAARAVGVALGAVLMIASLVPKMRALILAIPGPVLATYLTVLVALLFVVGIKVVFRDGLDYRKGLIVGVAFWVGVGFENDLIFADQLSGFAAVLLGNGMTAGGLLALLLTGLTTLAAPRPHRLRTNLVLAAGEEIRDFLAAFASSTRFGQAMADRLDAVSEEALLTLLAQEGARNAPTKRRLIVTARRERGGAVLEFVASTGGANVQDRIALLTEHANETSIEEEVSLRLLRHLSSSVRHAQYHDTDVVTIRVEPPAGESRTG